jgi:predicted MFS family arabinose efflux permease
MQLHDNPVEQPVGSPLTHLQEGFAYVYGTRPVRALLLLLAFVSLCGFPYMVLMPIFADRILGGGPRTLGILLGAAGVGALGGAVALAARRQVQGLGRIVALSVATTGVMLILFSFSRTLLLSAILVALIGCALMLQMAASNTLLQTMVVDRLRGRVMSFYSLSLLGMAPFGSLGAGVVATHIGAPDTVAVGGALCLLGAFLFGVRLPSLQREAAPLLLAQGATVSEPSGSAATNE